MTDVDDQSADDQSPSQTLIRDPVIYPVKLGRPRSHLRTKTGKFECPRGQFE